MSFVRSIGKGVTNFMTSYNGEEGSGMKKIIFLMVATLLFIGLVGTAGAMNYTMSIRGPVFGGSYFSSQLYNPPKQLLGVSELLHQNSPRTAAGRGWNNGFGMSFFDTSYVYRYIMPLRAYAGIGYQGGRHNFFERHHPKESQPATPVPEPATIIMVGMGLVGLAHVAKKKIKL